MLTHAEADHEGAAPAVIARATRRGWSSTAAPAGRRAVQRALPAALAAHARAPSRRTRARLIDVGAPALRRAVAAAGRRAAPDGNPNDRAIVARARRTAASSMLLTADAESNVTARSRSEPVDVLKVAHHGSADPGLPALLKRLRPRVAAIEVGRENTYGHPTQSTLAALRRASRAVVRTDRDGTVRLRVDGDRLRVQR